jgi:hypothetical protein
LPIGQIGGVGRGVGKSSLAFVTAMGTAAVAIARNYDDGMKRRRTWMKMMPMAFGMEFKLVLEEEGKEYK